MQCFTLYGLSSQKIKTVFFFRKDQPSIPKGHCDTFCWFGSPIVQGHNLSLIRLIINLIRLGLKPNRMSKFHEAWMTGDSMSTEHSGMTSKWGSGHRSQSTIVSGSYVSPKHLMHLNNLLWDASSVQHLSQSLGSCAPSVHLFSILFIYRTSSYK